MEIKIHTEETRVEELKSTIEIIKRAIERRSESGVQTTIPKIETKEEPPEIPQSPQLPQQEKRIEPIVPIVAPKEERPIRTPPPSVDLSAISMGGLSEKNGNRHSNSTPITRSVPHPEPPRRNEKDTLQDIIVNLKRKNPNGPLYMQNIVSLANAKGISEDRTRRLVSELKEEGSI